MKKKKHLEKIKTKHVFNSSSVLLVLLVQTRGFQSVGHASPGGHQSMSGDTHIVVKKKQKKTKLN